MKARKIELTNYRNIPSLSLELCENANMIYGDNGQGKTNLIEALWMFTGAKSFRGAKDSQLVRFGNEQAKLRLDFFAAEREQQAEITIDSRRIASLNEIELRSPQELAGRFCAVVFSPTHLTLVKNGPQEKRKFMDTAICQMKPKYIHLLGQYLRSLDQRNRLLKELSYHSGGSLLDTLDIWDAHLAAAGSVLVKTRHSFLQRLLPFAAGVYAGLSGEKEILSFAYRSTLSCELEGGIPEIEQQLRAALAARRQEDIRNRMTCCGPHRDDLELTLDGASARIYGSQGQQRSAVLALKLAECELLRETVGEYPVVLLDDVMSELDISRRDYLLNHLKNRQLVMTCCDKAYFKSLGSGNTVKLRAGEIVYSRKY